MAYESRSEDPEAQSTGGLVHGQLVQLKCRLEDGLERRLDWTKHPGSRALVCSVELASSSHLPSAMQQLRDAASELVRAAGAANASFETDFPLLGVTAVSSRAAGASFARRLAEVSFRANQRDGWRGAGPFQARWDQPDFRRRGLHRDQTAEELAWRLRVAQRFAADPWRSSPLCPWARVYTLFHACRSLEIALAICRGGFASLAMLDAGFYGQGIYLTGQLAYAAGVYGRQMRDEERAAGRGDGRITVLVCDVVVGNAYPVIEHPEGPLSLMGCPQVHTRTHLCRTRVCP